jgi:pantoate--beta-alanine ligase
MDIVHGPDGLDAARAGTLVPTMGALHAGHLALVRRAAGLRRPVIVSVFVNPTQFAPDEDYEAYPRTHEADAAAAADAGADVVFAPDVDVVYPPDDPPAPPPPLGAAATTPGLEDAHRPGHFAGVTQVVARLFDLVRPACAVFGEKDYQQLLVIREMVAEAGDRWPGLEIVAHETVREADGLAMSSRNAYLDAGQRERALGLAEALAAANRAEGPAAAEPVMRRCLAARDLAVDYAVVRDAATLLPVDDVRRPARALVAAHVDDIRLIDNVRYGADG